MNSKGGVGKSFIAQNVIVPKLFSEFGSATYVDFDGINSEAENLKNEKTIKVVKGNPDNIPEIGKDVVIDVGANLTTKNALKLFADLGLQDIATIVIPVGKRLSEVNETIKLYNSAKKLGFKKFVFAINGVVRDKEEEFFIWYKGLELTGYTPVREKISEEDRKEIVVPYDTRAVLSFIKDTQLRLPYTYYLEEKDFLKERGKLLKEAYENQNKEEVKRILEKSLILSALQEFFSEVEQWGESL